MILDIPVYTFGYLILSATITPTLVFWFIISYSFLNKLKKNKVVKTKTGVWTWTPKGETK